MNPWTSVKSKPLPVFVIVVFIVLSSLQPQNLGVAARSESESLLQKKIASANLVTAMTSTGDGSTAVATTPHNSERQRNRNSNNDDDNHKNQPILMVFSDVDGTLVHYPEMLGQEQAVSSNDDHSILKLPPSRTGLQGIISYKTLRQCQQLRHRHGIKLVLISGMRTSTMLQRLPFLPRADAYCCENGGRIFYPIDPNNTANDQYRGEVFQCVDTTKTKSDHDGDEVDSINSESNQYGSEEPASFGLVEDVEWRTRLEQQDAAGPDGYRGEKDDKDSRVVVPVEQRQGLLWEFAQSLLSSGFVLDWQGYATCFRVNRKQQTMISDDMFQALASSEDLSYCPPGLIRSTNLGHIDFAPACSGKRNCCQYLANKFMKDNDANDDSVKEVDWLSSVAVCWCDDDNDLELALACRHVFVPSVSSASMASSIEKHPDHFTVTGGASHGKEDGYGTKGTELAIERTVALVVQAKYHGGS